MKLHTRYNDITAPRSSVTGNTLEGELTSHVMCCSNRHSDFRPWKYTVIN